ncbi:MAG: molybdopterin molybdenumtransferase MoeA [Alphaproteobacteria bacterium]|nr:molybdopterin molybdenumtransferase MoeA [Alphaproteobacteria bacterium]
MISVKDARARILAGVAALAEEQVSLANAHGRVLARAMVSRRTQPPFAVSAMDGYAVRGADVATAPTILRQVGAVAAGTSFTGHVGQGETVRIFTGAPLPDGADTIVIQEDVTAEGDRIAVNAATATGRYVRPAGLDFGQGEALLAAGRLLTARDVGLAAAMNLPWLPVRRQPQVALIATGDEIALPGDPIGPHQIVSSNGPAMAALVGGSGGIVRDLGIAADTRQSLQALALGARGADVLVTLGGASVGEHDLVQSALKEQGLAVDFWQIAMRPGKPLMFGRLGETLVLGLPGNPVSSMVCALLFLRPLLAALLGLADTDPPRARATLGAPLGANDRREDYLRAQLDHDATGGLVATPFKVQDSSMLSWLARADCLILRPPLASALNAGATVEIIPFRADPGGF